MYSVKSISVLMVALSLSFVAINCGYDDGYNCYNWPRTNHYLDSVTVNKIDIRKKAQFVLLHEKNDTILDTLKLQNVGSLKTVLNLLDYSMCGSDDIKDYVEGLASHFVGNENKKSALVLNILPVYIEYYSQYYSYYSNYSLDQSESIEVKWNNYVFKSTISRLETTTGAGFYPSITLGRKPFANVYKVSLNDSCYAYLNKSTIAQIRIGKETWTNVEQ